MKELVLSLGFGAVNCLQYYPYPTNILNLEIISTETLPMSKIL